MAYLIKTNKVQQDIEQEAMRLDDFCLYASLASHLNFSKSIERTARFL